MSQMPMVSQGGFYVRLLMVTLVPEVSLVDVFSLERS